MPDAPDVCLGPSAIGTLYFLHDNSEIVTYEAVLFDMDGVLLTGTHTPRHLYDEATTNVLADHGITEPPDGFLNPNDVDEWREACAVHGVPADELWTRRESVVSELENAHIADGGRPPHDDVDVLDSIHHPTGIVSNNRHATTTFAAEHHAWNVDVTFGRDPTLEGYERVKPNPHYLTRAIDDLGIHPETTLYVGDRITDVRAAHAAGAESALLARENHPGGRHEPTHVIQTLRELPPLLATG